VFEVEVWQYPKDHDTQVGKNNQSVPRAESPNLPQDILFKSWEMPCPSHHIITSLLCKMDVPTVYSISHSLYNKSVVQTSNFHTTPKVAVATLEASRLFALVVALGYLHTPVQFCPLLKPGGNLQKKQIQSLPEFFTEEAACSLHFPTLELSSFSSSRVHASVGDKMNAC
jgi:hypothetical protein